MALPPHLADLEGRLASRVDEALAGFRRAFEARLREATERLLADATDIPSPNVADLLADVESEALDSAPRREGAHSAAESLLGAARAFDRAATQAEVLTALVAAGGSAADRLALFLVRDHALVAFESSGILAAPERGRVLPFEGALRERLSAVRGCLVLGAEAAADAAEELGWSPNGPAVVVPLILRDRVAALLWAERTHSAPDLAPLQLLTSMAAQRLELQALSARAFTPTLYEGIDAPGAPLPLWSAPAEPIAESAAIALPEPDEQAAEPQLDAAESFEFVSDESLLRAPLAAPTIERPTEPDTETETETALEAVADELWTGSVTAPFDLAAFESASEPAPASESVSESKPEPVAEALFEPVEPAPIGATWELSNLESPSQLFAPLALEPFEREEIAVESEAELAVELESEGAFEPQTEAEADESARFAAEPELETPAIESPATTGEIDLLGTMRLPILTFPLAGETRQPEEATAPLQVEEVSSRGEAATTHELPAPAFAAPAEPDLSAPDPSEDATVLTRRIPIMPMMPLASPAASAEPAPFPTQPSAAVGAPAVTPFGTLIAPFAPMAPLEASTPVPAVPSLVPPVPPPPVENPMDRTASRQRSTEVAPPADLQGPGRAFLGGRMQRSVAESPTHEEAKRLARLLISEIKLYNEEQVLEGRRNRDLYHRLKEDIDRSRQIYDERVDPAVRSGSDFFHQELVRSLAGGDPRALGI